MARVTEPQDGDRHETQDSAGQEDWLPKLRELAEAGWTGSMAELGAQLHAGSRPLSHSQVKALGLKLRAARAQLAAAGLEVAQTGQRTGPNRAAEVIVRLAGNPPLNPPESSQAEDSAGNPPPRDAPPQRDAAKEAPPQRDASRDAASGKALGPSVMPVIAGHEGHDLYPHSHSGLACSGRYYCNTCSDPAPGLRKRTTHTWLDGPPCNGELMELPPIGPLREASRAAFAAAAAAEEE
jgi:hypothetical protein